MVDDSWGGYCVEDAALTGFAAEPSRVVSNLPTANRVKGGSQAKKSGAGEPTFILPHTISLADSHPHT